MELLSNSFILSYLNLNHSNSFHAARFEKETRYYSIQLERDLLGDWTIVASNGRKNSKLGRTRILAFPDFSYAFKEFCKIVQIRFQRGYRLTNYLTSNLLFDSILTTLYVHQFTKTITH